MKKYLIALFLLLPAISFASIDVNLGYGSKGVEVQELQEFLSSKGFLNSQITGNFFSLTRNAVVTYQKSVGISSTGYVGILTRTSINNELAVVNTPSVVAQVAETGTTTIPQTIPAPVVPQPLPIIVPSVPTFGSTLTNNQITMPEINCTLTADSNAGAPSGFATLTWTSNADSVTLTNNHNASYSPTEARMEPASGGTKKFQLSSEAGENNIFTAHFVLKEQTKDCTVSVLTQ